MFYLIFASPEGYRLVFHYMCIFLCVRYGNVLANTRTYRLVTISGAHWWVLLYTLITLRIVFFIVECSIAHILCAMHVFEVQFGHHPHPLGYLCAKFRFFHDLHCRASPRKNIAYSITHSITWSSPSLFDVPGTKAGDDDNNDYNKMVLIKSIYLTLSQSSKSNSNKPRSRFWHFSCLQLIYDCVDIISCQILLIYRHTTHFQQTFRPDYAHFGTVGHLKVSISRGQPVHKIWSL